jgi:hypothetical protein
MENMINRTKDPFLMLLKEKLKELDRQLENTNRTHNEDDFKILIGKQAFAEDLIYEIQGAAA